MEERIDRPSRAWTGINVCDGIQVGLETYTRGKIERFDLWERGDDSRPVEKNLCIGVDGEHIEGREVEGTQRVSEPLGHTRHGGDTQRFQRDPCRTALGRQTGDLARTLKAVEVEMANTGRTTIPDL